MGDLDVSKAVIASDPQVFREALAYLARCQSEYNRLADIVSTKNPASLRCALDDVARERYESEGVKSYDAKIGGRKVATYSVRATKEEPERTEARFDVDAAAAYEWLTTSVDPDWWGCYLKARAAGIAEMYMRETGEQLPFATLVENRIPAVPSMFKNMVLKVDEQGMAAALEEAGTRSIEGSVA